LCPPVSHGGAGARRQPDAGAEARRQDPEELDDDPEVALPDEPLVELDVDDPLEDVSPEDLPADLSVDFSDDFSEDFSEGDLSPEAVSDPPARLEPAPARASARESVR
jgi:hypothetical protein